MTHTNTGCTLTELYYDLYFNNENEMDEQQFAMIRQLVATLEDWLADDNALATPLSHADRRILNYRDSAAAETDPQWRAYFEARGELWKRFVAEARPRQEALERKRAREAARELDARNTGLRCRWCGEAHGGAEACSR